MANYTLMSLMVAHVDALRFENKHPDLATYHTGLYNALLAAFQRNPADLPLELSGVFYGAARSIADTGGAFDGSMECPSELIPLVERHSRDIGRAVAALSKAHYALMVDIMERAFGPCSKVVSSDELRQLGFDDRNAPEECDYF